MTFQAWFVWGMHEKRNFNPMKQFDAFMFTNAFANETAIPHIRNSQIITFYLIIYHCLTSVLRLFNHAWEHKSSPWNPKKAFLHPKNTGVSPPRGFGKDILLGHHAGRIHRNEKHVRLLWKLGAAGALLQEFVNKDLGSVEVRGERLKMVQRGEVKAVYSWK